MPKKIVSLGSNCSVCYHLINLGLRSQAYPFDWTRLSLGNLNQVLSNRFAGFTELSIKKFSPAHPIITNGNEDLDGNSGSVILVNKQNIQFAHEISDPENLIEFTAGLSRRIERFLSLENPTFVRLETANLTSSQMCEYDKLVGLLDGLFGNYQLVLISRLKPSNNKIIWVKLESFDSNWKYPSLNWENIFNL
jgi:hypothetical protein